MRIDRIRTEGGEGATESMEKLDNMFDEEFSSIQSRLLLFVQRQRRIADSCLTAVMSKRLKSGATDCLAAVEDLYNLLKWEGHRRQWLERENTKLSNALGRSRQQLAEAQAAEALSRHRALHDELTSLPNRAAFYEELRFALDRSTVGSQPVTVMYLDLDGFKALNDSHGHHIGDELLQKVALHLLHAIDGEYRLGRIGGDEFACIVLRPLDQLQEIAERLYRAASQPCRIQKKSIALRISIGIATSPADGTAVAELVRNADAAMYSAKRMRSKYAFAQSG
jgi:diguanylate cyclase (GGDEF)-like protein